QARQFLPNSSRIPESLAYVARRRGQWDRSESYFNEAERLDPRNVYPLSQQALSYIALRRFPEALRKLDHVLDFTPDDLDTLVVKAGIAQAQGDLLRASAILAPLHPAARDSAALETQVYQAILERRPAQIIVRLKEILAKPDPALGSTNGDSTNGELCFYLGWAQEVAGDHAAAQESWRQARSELESSLKEQPENFDLIGILALTNMGLGDKAAALALSERAMTTNPIEKDALIGPRSIEILARVAARTGDPDRAISALQKLLSIPYAGPLPTGNIPLTPALLRLDPMFDPLRNDPRFEKLVSAKSIAVLPFENRSEDKANAYFADGIEDEILTRLSKIADLKVISRTSTQHYKSAPKNLPEIAKQLGVANILEGSVQKSGDAVRVNVQLIKAANDSYLWADTFDRKLTDIFSVESEVAKAIADQLQAHLSGREEQVIAAKPTDNPEAYDAYLRGLAYTLKTLYTPANNLGAQKYLREAVRLDPKFALSWALLSYVDAVGYITQALQPTLALREEARQAAETALALQPNLGEALHAKGWYYYACLKDYDTAVRYFEQARQFLPNSSRIPEALAYVARRRGQ
ncbi:MAG: tetratricopeptide repeat protein, partial [Chthoniobacterales bacterium]